MSFIVYYCTSCVACILVFSIILYYLSFCLSACLLFVYLWAMLPDSNKMMMMITSKLGLDRLSFLCPLVPEKNFRGQVLQVL